MLVLRDTALRSARALAGFLLLRPLFFTHIFFLLSLKWQNKMRRHILCTDGTPDRLLHRPPILLETFLDT